MKYLKNVGMSFIYIIGLLVVLTFFITLLNYFNIIGSSLTAILEIIIFVLALFVGGMIIGRRSNKKGWLEVLLLFNYLALDHSFQIKDLIFYLILIISTMFGSMVGINKKLN